MHNDHLDYRCFRNRFGRFLCGDGEVLISRYNFLTVPRGCLQFVIVVFPDHTHLLFIISR